MRFIPALFLLAACGSSDHASPDAASLPDGSPDAASLPDGSPDAASSPDAMAPSSTPTILTFEPTHDSGGHDLDTTVCVTFSEPMNQASTEAAFSIATTQGGVDGALAWSPGNKLCFDRAGQWDRNDVVTYAIGAGATDLAGNPLVPVSVTFRVWRRDIHAVTADAALTGTVSTGGTTFPGAANVGYGTSVYGFLRPRFTFPLPPLPAGGTLQSATLRLKQSDAPQGDPYYDPIDKVATVVVASRCEYTTLETALSSGCVGSPVTLSTDGTLGYKEVDWTAHTQAALTASKPVQLGLGLTRSHFIEDEICAAFFYAGTAAASRPELVVVYDYPGD